MAPLDVRVHVVLPDKPLYFPQPHAPFRHQLHDFPGKISVTDYIINSSSGLPVQPLRNYVPPASVFLYAHPLCHVAVRVYLPDLVFSQQQQAPGPIWNHPVHLGSIQRCSVTQLSVRPISAQHLPAFTHIYPAISVLTDNRIYILLLINSIVVHRNRITLPFQRLLRICIIVSRKIQQPFPCAKIDSLKPRHLCPLRKRDSFQGTAGLFISKIIQAISQHLKTSYFSICIAVCIDSGCI